VATATERARSAAHDAAVAYANAALSGTALNANTAHVDATRAVTAAQTAANIAITHSLNPSSNP
jgi:hypothetical protein